MYAGYQYRNSEKVSRLQSFRFLSAETDVLSFPACPQWRNFVRLHQRTLNPRPRLTCPCHLQGILWCFFLGFGALQVLAMELLAHGQQPLGGSLPPSPPFSFSNSYLTPTPSFLLSHHCLCQGDRRDEEAQRALTEQEGGFPTRRARAGSCASPYPPSFKTQRATDTCFPLVCSRPLRPPGSLSPGRTLSIPSPSLEVTDSFSTTSSDTASPEHLQP